MPLPSIFQPPYRGVWIYWGVLVVLGFVIGREAGMMLYMLIALPAFLFALPWGYFALHWLAPNGVNLDLTQLNTITLGYHLALLSGMLINMFILSLLVRTFRDFIRRS